MKLLSVILLTVPAVFAQYGGGDSSTSSSASSAAASTTASSSSSVQTVAVGQNGLTFSPNSLTVAPGKQVVFQIYPGGHSVTQGDMNNPCQPANGSAFWSGTINSNSGPSSTAFTVTVNSTDPIYVYCATVGHCQAGMVAVINPSSDQTLSQWMSAAKGSSKSSSPASAQGGVLGAAPSASSTGGAATTSAPAGGAGNSLAAFSLVTVAVVLMAMLMV